MRRHSPILVLPWLCLAAIALVAPSGCDDREDSFRDNLRHRPTRILVKSPKALAVVKRGSYRLEQMVQDGELTTVKFVDDSGREVDVQAKQLCRFNGEYFSIVFDQEVAGDLVECTAFFDVSNGVLLDIDGFHTMPGFVLGGKLYLAKDNVVYCIDLATRVGTPMFHPLAHNTGGSINWGGGGHSWAFHVSAGGWVHINDGIVGQHMMFDSLGNPPEPSWIRNAYDLGPGAGRGALIWRDGVYYKIGVDTTGSSAPYTHTISYGTVDTAYNHIADLHVVTNDIPSLSYCRTLPDRDSLSTYEYNMYQPSRFYLAQDGYVKITFPTPTTADFQWVDKDMSSLFGQVIDNHQRGVVYWRDGDTLRKFDIENDDAAVDLITDDRMLDWWRIGDTIFYTASISHLIVGTYRIDSPGVAVLHELSDMELVRVSEISL